MRTFLSLAASAALCAVGPVGCSACGLYFETDVKGRSTVQGSPLGGVLSAFPALAGFQSFDVSQTSEFQNKGIKKEDVNSVQLKRLTLKITAPDDMDFSWMSSIRFSAEASGKKDLVAQKNDVDKLGLKAPNPSFDCDVLDVELMPYLVAPSMAITTDVAARLPRVDTTLEATARFGVSYNLIK